MKTTIPEKERIYHFFDSGRFTPSRCYEAKVECILPYSQECLVDAYDSEYDCIMPKTLQDILKENHEDTPELYAETTDFFVACSIPNYDEYMIWFTRTPYGEWFSMDIQSCWQSGTLDIDGSLYKRGKRLFEETYPSDNYDDYTQKGFSDKYKINKYGYIVNS